MNKWPHRLGSILTCCLRLAPFGGENENVHVRRRVMKSIEVPHPSFFKVVFLTFYFFFGSPLCSFVADCAFLVWINHHDFSSDGSTNSFKRRLRSFAAWCLLWCWKILFFSPHLKELSIHLKPSAFHPAELPDGPNVHLRSLENVFHLWFLQRNCQMLSNSQNAHGNTRQRRCPPCLVLSQCVQMKRSKLYFRDKINIKQMGTCIRKYDNKSAQNRRYER